MNPTNNDLPEPDDCDDDLPVDDYCPNCRRVYDEIDYDAQICSKCKFINDGSNILDGNNWDEDERDDDDPNDSRNL